jgi:hypothetical protein
VNWRRARRFGVSAIGLDIVFPFGKMSTKPDQAHFSVRYRRGRSECRTAGGCGANPLAATKPGIAAADSSKQTKCKDYKVHCCHNEP